jgi:hypothetical protein
MMGQEIEDEEQGGGKAELIFASSVAQEAGDDLFAGQTTASRHPSAMDNAIISATSRSTLLRMGDRLLFAGIACTHPFDLELQVDPELQPRDTEEERHLTKSCLVICLLQVAKYFKPGL